MTALTCRANSLSVAEPLAGTAPTASRLLIVEQPGPWGYSAVQNNRMNEAIKANLELLATPGDIKVFLARRQDRKQLAGTRNIWFMQRIGRKVAAGHRQIPDNALISIPEDSASAAQTGSPHRGEESTRADRGHPLSNFARAGSPSIGPQDLERTLFVCTNGARDQCCAVAGRDLLRRLSKDVWEVSHLGGHRFAPTALRFPDGLLFGRLDVASARELISGRDPKLSHTRGRFGRDPWQQIAELSVAESTGIPLPELDGLGEPASTTVSDGRGTTWAVSLSQRRLAPRKVSCNKQPTVDNVWMPTVVPSA